MFLGIFNYARLNLITYMVKCLRINLGFVDTFIANK